MANSTEKTVIQALLQQQSTELSGHPLFTDFESEDAVLAAFVDERLTAKQERVVKDVLSSNPMLRQQWLAVRAAQASQPAVGRSKVKLGWSFGGIGAVASVALAAVLLWPNKEPEPQLELAAKREMRAPVNVASAPDYADIVQVVPLSAWQAFWEVYEGEESTASPIDQTAQLFGQLASNLRALEATACQDGREPQDEEVLPVKTSWRPLSERFAEQLAPLTPQNDAQWCQLGAILKQKAQKTITDNNPQR
ncbi:MAG: hypothetical protein EP328_03315 [Gammaproteobacteria bacterium]|nr:MAG: hypothetical protein EP328_03315 [Gammaproteobacteria bacterium]